MKHGKNSMQHANTFAIVADQPHSDMAYVTTPAVVGIKFRVKLSQLGSSFLESRVVVV